MRFHSNQGGSKKPETGRKRIGGRRNKWTKYSLTAAIGDHPLDCTRVLLEETIQDIKKNEEEKIAPCSKNKLKYWPIQESSN